MFGDVEVSVCTNAPAEELYARFIELGEHLHEVGAAMTASGDAWEQAQDPVEKDGLWPEYCRASREYRVLSAWWNVVYAAYIFATDGVECAVFDAHSTVS